MGTKIGLVLVCKVLKLLNKYSFFKIKLNRSCKDDFTDSILKDNSFKSYACTR